MSELTLTVIRLGLLALLWIFVFSVVGVLRGDLYGTRVLTRGKTGSPRRPFREPVASAVPGHRPDGPKASSASSRRILRRHLPRIPQTDRAQAGRGRFDPADRQDQLRAAEVGLFWPSRCTTLLARTSDWYDRRTKTRGMPVRTCSSSPMEWAATPQAMLQARSRSARWSVSTVRTPAQMRLWTGSRRCCERRTPSCETR